MRYILLRNPIMIDDSWETKNHGRSTSAFVKSWHDISGFLILAGSLPCYNYYLVLVHLTIICMYCVTAYNQHI